MINGSKRCCESNDHRDIKVYIIKVPKIKREKKLRPLQKVITFLIKRTTIVTPSDFVCIFKFSNEYNKKLNICKSDLNSHTHKSFYYKDFTDVYTWFEVIWYDTLKTPVIIFRCQ